MKSWVIRKKKLLFNRIKEKVLFRYFPHGILSLTVDEPFKLPFHNFPGITWSVKSEELELKRGQLIAKRDCLGAKARGDLYFCLPYKKIRIPITIVPWHVKANSLAFKKRVGSFTILGACGKHVFFTNENELFETDDCFNTHKKISDIPWKQKYRSDRSLLLKTPVGWFLRTDGGVVYSKDLKSWSVAIDIGTRGMFQHLDYSYDKDSGVTSIYAAEYSTEPSHRHGVYRGDYTQEGLGDWRRVFEFFSSAEGNESNSLDVKQPAARHIHALAVDKKENLLWIATGDSNKESGIFVSADKGRSFKRYATGSQHYRTLMLIFTDQYLYWNMDTHLEDQVVYRVKRSLVDKSRIQNLDDSRSPYRASDVAPGAEVVCSLPYGAQWYGIIVKDKENKDCILMSASPESQVPETGEVPHRDWNARLFLIENIDEFEAVVSEVSAIPPMATLTGKAKRYCRVDPRCQDSKGNIYFMGNNSLFNEAVIGELK